MSYDVSAIPNFKRELKKLAKKFPSLKDDFARLIKSLEEDPEQGRVHVNKLIVHKHIF